MTRKANTDQPTDEPAPGGKNEEDEEVEMKEEDEDDDLPIAQIAHRLMHTSRSPSHASASPARLEPEEHAHTLTTPSSASPPPPASVSTSDPAGHARHSHTTSHHSTSDEMSGLTARGLAHIFGWQLKRAAPLPRRRGTSSRDTHTLRFALRHRQSHKTLTVEIKPRSAYDEHMSLVTINGAAMWPKQAALRLTNETLLGFATGSAGQEGRTNTSTSNSFASAQSVLTSAVDEDEDEKRHAHTTDVSAAPAAGREEDAVQVRHKAEKRPRSASPALPKAEEVGGQGEEREVHEGQAAVHHATTMREVEEESYRAVRLRSEASVSTAPPLPPLVAEEHHTGNTAESFTVVVEAAAATTTTTTTSTSDVTPAKATTTTTTTAVTHSVSKAKTSNTKATTTTTSTATRATAKSATPSHTKGSATSHPRNAPSSSPSPPARSHHKNNHHITSKSVYSYVGHGWQPLAQAVTCDGYSSTQMTQILAHTRAMQRQCGYELANTPSEQSNNSDRAMLNAVLHDGCYTGMFVTHEAAQAEEAQDEGGCGGGCVRQQMKQGLHTAIAAGRLRGDALHAGVQALQQCEDEEAQYFLPSNTTQENEKDSSKKHGVSCKGTKTITTTINTTDTAEREETHHSVQPPLSFPRIVPPTFLPVSGAALLDVQYRMNALTHSAHDTPLHTSSPSYVEGSCSVVCAPASDAAQPRYTIHDEGIVPAPRIAITQTYHLRNTQRVQLACPPHSPRWRNTTTEVVTTAPTTTTTTSSSNGTDEAFANEEPGTAVSEAVKDEKASGSAALPAMTRNAEADLMLYVHSRFMTPSVRAMIAASATTTTATTTDVKPEVAENEHSFTTTTATTTTGNSSHNAAHAASATRDIDKLLRRADNIQPIPMPDLEWYYGSL